MRKQYARFRISNTNLQIEIGRYRIMSDKRFCEFCKDEIEDEMHFMLDCDTYNEERISLLYNYLDYEKRQDSFIDLLASQEDNIIHNVSRFIYNAMAIRQNKCTQQKT